jgi:hypothetical protein
LHPAREPLALLAAIRHKIGEYNFAGQYLIATARIRTSSPAARVFRFGGVLLGFVVTRADGDIGRGRRGSIRVTLC